MSLTQTTNTNDPAVELDELDFAILGQLQEDGRRSFTDMAENLKTSAQHHS